MRYKVTVSYDGSNYCGWQVQPNGISIQATIEKVLKKISKQDIGIIAAGRTDAKVHAKGQVFHFDSDLKMTPTQWKKAFNSLLPDDIYINEVKRVHKDFHARYDALWKKYTYTIYLGENDLFNRHFHYACPYKLNINKMKKATKVFIGTHDFSSFNATGINEIKDQVRTIYDIEIEKKDDYLIITFIGTGFLRYMVRMISQTLIEVGRNKINIKDVKVLLNSKKKGIVPYNAPANGLCLQEVGYKPYQ